MEVGPEAGSTIPTSEWSSTAFHRLFRNRNNTLTDECPSPFFICNTPRKSGWRWTEVPVVTTTSEAHHSALGCLQPISSLYSLQSVQIVAPPTTNPRIGTGGKQAIALFGTNIAEFPSQSSRRSVKRHLSGHPKAVSRHREVNALQVGSPNCNQHSRSASSRLKERFCFR